VGRDWARWLTGNVSRKADAEYERGMQHFLRFVTKPFSHHHRGSNKVFYEPVFITERFLGRAVGGAVLESKV